MSEIHAKLHGDAPATIDDVEELLRVHEEHEKEMINQLRADIMKAFPNGDAEAHCDYHAKLIKAAEAQEEFWQAAKIELMKKGLGALWEVGRIVLILAAVGFLAKFGIALPIFGGDK